MKALRPFLMAWILFVPFTAGAQINIFLGGNLQGHYAWINGDEATLQPGFGGGLSFVYWENEYWFIKAGLDYCQTSSSRLDYPEDFGVPILEPEDKLQITFTEQSLGIPLSFNYRPYESGPNTLLITGTLKTLFVLQLKEEAESLGELKLKGSGIHSRTKTNIGIGVGYQRELDRNLFLHLIPSIHMDVRSIRSYRYFAVTAELIFGVY